MKKRFFMIIAIMTIAAIAVVSFVACNDDKKKDENKTTEYTEVGGLKIDNLKTEIYNKSLKVSAEQTATDSEGKIVKVTSVTEYEPYKAIIQGKRYDETEYTRYSYKLGDTNRYAFIEKDNDYVYASVEPVFAETVMLIAGNKDLYEYKDNVYTIKADKYNEYYKSAFEKDEDLPADEEGEAYKGAFSSMKITFAEKTITVVYSVSMEGSKMDFKYVLSDIGSTTVTIPQEIYDMPLHDVVTLDDISGINNKSYTADVKYVINGNTTEMEAKFDSYNNSLVMHDKTANKTAYVWYDYKASNHYAAEPDADNNYRKVIADSNYYYSVTEMVRELIYNEDWFELVDGVYKVAENKIETYIYNNGLEQAYGSENMADIIKYVKSIEITIGKNITVSYKKNIAGMSEEMSMVIKDFYTTIASVPDSIKGLELTTIQ